MIWSLWLKDKIRLTEFEQLSLDDVDQATRALDTWDSAG